MAKDPAFLLYSRDWIEGTAEMMPDEKGIFIDLLCYQHQRGGIPNDINRIARMVGLSIDDFNRIWKTLKLKFIPCGDMLVNSKLVSVIEERSLMSKKKRISGIFSSLCKQHKIEKLQYVAIKKKFKVDTFLEFEDAYLPIEIESWFNKTYETL